MGKYNVIGRSHQKVDGVDKATGVAKYAADIKFDNLAYLSVLRSTIPHGVIKQLDYSQAEKLDGVITVLTAEDIPGQNRTGVILKDEPVLTAERVKQIGDPIALVAAETQQIAAQAVKMIKVEYEELPALLTVDEALAEGAVQIHDDHPNLMERKVVRGNLAKGFAAADVIVEREYKTGRVEHSYIEPEVGVATVEDGVLTLWITSQNVHFDCKEVARNLALNMNQVRVIEATTGGGFGGKLDVSAQVYLGLAALKIDRPVKYVYSREESIQTTCKRHPYTIKYKSGATKDGKLTAAEIEFITETGAYASFGPGVLTRGAVHVTGPYEIPHVKIEGKLVFTNNPFCGAMRGFGVPQVAFAHETQLDLLAEKLRLSPADIRLKNAFGQGSVTATGQKLKSSVGIKETILQARDLAEDIL